MAKLIDVIQKLKKEAEGIESKYENIIKRNPEKRKHLISMVENLGEILLILNRIYKQGKEKKKIKKTLFFSKTRLSEKRILELSNESLNLTKHIILDIKSLYEWAYHINVILEKIKVKTENFLESIVFIRSVFITHAIDYKHLEKLDLRGNIRSDKNFENVEILVIPFPLKPEDCKNILELKKKLTPYLPELISEKNNSELLKLVFRNLDKIPRKNRLRRNTKDFLAKTGMITHPPYMIAEILLRALKKYRKVTKV